MQNRIRDYDPARFGPAGGFQQLVDGTLIFLPDSHVIGYCASLTHPGFMTESQVIEHRCLTRACPHLRKLPEHPFWKQKKQQTKVQKAVQQSIQAHIDKAAAFDPQKDALLKARKAAKTESSQQNCLARISEAAKIWLDRYDLDETKFLIVSISTYGRSTKYYRIQYLTTENYNDAERYKNFVSFIEHRTQCVIKLVRVKDQYGNYPTIQQYHSRRKWK